MAAPHPLAVRFAGYLGVATWEVHMTTEDEVVGLDNLVAKSSAVDATGAPRLKPIEGVTFRPTRPVAHDDGVVTEVARTAWDEVDLPIVHVHITTTLPGRVRGWGLHRASTDRLFVVSGLVSIVVFDGRLASPTYGVVNQFMVSERLPGLLIIPPNLYHGWKNIGTEEAFIINMPTSTYNHDQPDALDLPYESPLASEVVPFRW
jgi:dTDP-4-dehydrorhamnose 3,5-epimerase